MATFFAALRRPVWGFHPQTPGTLRWGSFLNDEKGTKESPEGGRPPLGIPPLAEVRLSISGIQNRTVRRFHRRAMPSHPAAFGHLAHPSGRLAGRWVLPCRPFAPFSASAPRAAPVQAPHGGVLPGRFGGTRAEPAGGTVQPSMLPPERETGTSAYAPVALSGVLRGDKS